MIKGGDMTWIVSPQPPRRNILQEETKPYKPDEGLFMMRPCGEAGKGRDGRL